MSMQDKTIGAWLSELGSRAPTPGGGSAAALSAAISAGLLEMVANYTIGKRWFDREARMHQVLGEASRLRLAAAGLAADDEVAFTAVGAAYKLPKGSPHEQREREVAIQHALRGAAEPPIQVGQLAMRLLELGKELAEQGNPNVLSE